MPDRLMRTALFVPASRPERIPKALAAGADMVIVDLEDAVEAQAKAQARGHIASFAADHSAEAITVRVNAASTPWFTDDLDLCKDVPAITGIVLAKAESADEVRRAAATGKSVIPLLESAQGIANLAEISRSPGVARLAFGNLDFGLDLGLDAGSEGAEAVLAHVRSQLVLQSRIAGIGAPLYGVWPDIKDSAGLERAARTAKGMGFSGLLCIHPAQVETVHAVFAASREQIEWAGRILRKVQEAGEAVFEMDGEMVDMPVIERARRILRQARP